AHPYSHPRSLHDALPIFRENARLQSFPDWFAFQGKYTTGGKRRRHEVPRFTQVANAVPPLLSEALGEMLIDIVNDRRIRSRALRSEEHTSELQSLRHLVC